MLNEEFIVKEMEELKKKFNEMQELRAKYIEEIKKIDTESLKLDGAFMAYQKMLDGLKSKSEEDVKVEE